MTSNPKTWHDEARQLVKSWGMRDKMEGEEGKIKKKVKISTQVPPQWGFTDVGDWSYKNIISSKIKEMPMPWKWCVESMYIILNLCMHTKRNPHHKMLVFKYIHQLHLHDLAFSSFHIFFWNKMSFKIKKTKMQKTTFYVLPIHIYCINTYINIFYIQQP